MIIEISEGLMTLIVLASILTFLIEPVIVLLVTIVSIITLIGFGITGQEITIKSKDSIIIQMNNSREMNSTKQIKIIPKVKIDQ